ncbi:MAG: thymidine phosphorylase [Acidimicrobiia bacterium]
MNIVDLIIAKRDGRRLSDDEIRWLIPAYTEGRIAEEQMSAMAMAIFFRGMEPDELAVWTRAMIDAGEVLDLSMLNRPTTDKHSTGGVGDKISLPLVPLVATCGAAVPQMGGRGLGHTGGTIDKMESFTGWSGVLPMDQMRNMLDDIGGGIFAAGPNLAPADRKLYALRDVTGTVASIPLIASSIMSKKIAEGTKSLVLDVKTGSGAFMVDLGDARRLAETMVAIGEANDVRTVALITNMDSPLGRAAGNALEVSESLEVLRGGGPSDVVELTVALAVEMCALAGVDADPAAVLASGAAEATWRKMVAAQGGDPDQTMPVSTQRHIVRAERSGYLNRLDALSVGICAWRLGAGRDRKEDPVSFIAGVVCEAKPGDHVEAGQPLLELHIDDPSRLERALAALHGAIDIGPEPAVQRPMVIERISA